jgi:hypothetical protein
MCKYKNKNSKHINSGKTYINENTKNAYKERNKILKHETTIKQTLVLTTHRQRE